MLYVKTARHFGNDRPWMKNPKGRFRVGQFYIFTVQAMEIIQISLGRHGKYFVLDYFIALTHEKHFIRVSKLSPCKCYLPDYLLFIQQGKS